MVVGWAAQLVRGFCMGAADLVPGVSGGTVALLLGIYERLVAQIRLGAGALARLGRLDRRGFVMRLGRVDWPWLLALLGGIGIAIISLASWLEHQIETNPVEVSAVFFGLVAASVWVAWQLVRRQDGPRVIVLIGVATASFFLLGLRGGGISDPSLLLVLVSGAVAICAMILPGISGSFILVMLGMYDYMLSAVNERRAEVLAVFLVGAVAGLASFSTLLSWLLDRYRDTVLAALVGLMLGSLRVLWPWPAGEQGLENVALGRPESGELPLAVALAVAAAVAVLGVTALVHKTGAPQPARRSRG